MSSITEIADDFIKKSTGFVTHGTPGNMTTRTALTRCVEDAIEEVYTTYRKTKGRSERSELRKVYEELVSRDTKRAGFRRYVHI